MEIAFATKRLRDTCRSEGAMRRSFGPEAAEALKVCLAELRAAESVLEILTAQISFKMKLESNLVLVGPVSGLTLMLSANHNINPVNSDGMLDWSQVGRVQIVEIRHET